MLGTEEMEAMLGSEEREAMLGTVKRGSHGGNNGEGEPCYEQ